MAKLMKIFKMHKLIKPLLKLSTVKPFSIFH